MEEYFVYQHINKLNGKRYIGITKQMPESRWGLSGVNYKNSCPAFWNAIKKYGWDNFSHQIVQEGLSKDAACEMEIQLISTYKTQDRRYGYNILEGGSTPSIPEETRKKMSAAMKGNKNGSGHKCSEETKEKIRSALVGKPFTEEHKERLSRAKKGVSHCSPSPETRKKIANSHAKFQVYCQENAVIYESIQECARQLGLYATNVCKCCKGKLLSTGGYHLKYYNINTVNA